MPFQELPTNEEDIRRLAQYLSLPSRKKNGSDKKNNSKDRYCLHSIHEIVKGAFFEIMITEMFAALTDQHSSVAGNKVSQETFTSSKTSSHSYVHNMLKDAFPHMLDRELPAYKKVFCNLVQAIVLQDLEEPSGTSRCNAPRKAGIIYIIAETFPNASEKELCTYKEVFHGWVQALVSPEETYRNLPKKIYYLLAALNAHHLLRTLKRFSSSNALFERSRDRAAKIFRILKMGCQRGVSSKERLCSQIFLGVLIVYNILPLFAAGIQDKRSFIKRAFTKVVNVFVAMYFVYQLRFLKLWFLFN